MSDKNTGPSLFRRNQKTTCPQGVLGLEPPCGGLPEQVLCWPALGPRPFLSVLLLVAGLVPGIICPVSLLSRSRGAGPRRCPPDAGVQEREKTVFLLYQVSPWLSSARTRLSLWSLPLGSSTVLGGVSPHHPLPPSRHGSALLLWLSVGVPHGDGLNNVPPKAPFPQDPDPVCPVCS